MAPKTSHIALCCFHCLSWFLFHLWKLGPTIHFLHIRDMFVFSHEADLQSAVVVIVVIVNKHTPAFVTCSATHHFLGVTNLLKVNIKGKLYNNIYLPLGIIFWNILYAHSIVSAHLYILFDRQSVFHVFSSNNHYIKKSLFSAFPNSSV